MERIVFELSKSRRAGRIKSALTHSVTQISINLFRPGIIEFSTSLQPVTDDTRPSSNYSRGIYRPIYRCAMEPKPLRSSSRGALCCCSQSYSAIVCIVKKIAPRGRKSVHSTAQPQDKERPAINTCLAARNASRKQISSRIRGCSAVPVYWMQYTALQFQYKPTLTFHKQG